MAAHQDNQLIKACAAYTKLAAEVRAYEAGLPAKAPPHPRYSELEGMLDLLCTTQATTLAGVAVRLQWLLRCEPTLIEERQNGGHAERMCAALLRDLRDVLRMETDQRGVLDDARARGKRLARSWMEAEAVRSRGIV